MQTSFLGPFFVFWTVRRPWKQHFENPIRIICDSCDDRKRIVPILENQTSFQNKQMSNRMRIIQPQFEKWSFFDAKRTIFQCLHVLEKLI